MLVTETFALAVDVESHQPVNAVPEVLPTLEQILNGETLAPVCLHNFQIVMGDRLNKEELLDFYLDVRRHEMLWRNYIEQSYNVGRLTEADLTDGYQSFRVLNSLLRAPQPSVRLQNAASVTVESNASTDALSLQDRNRMDISESAQKLFLLYLAPSASKDITSFLPNNVVQRLHQELNRIGESFHKTTSSTARDNLFLFQEAKQYIFLHLQTHCYPEFLALKVWKNTTYHQQLGRLVVGILCLMGSLSAGLSFLFLGYSQWSKRFLIFIPFWFSVLNISIYVTGLNPIWALVFKKSETTTFKFNTIEEPQVMKILVYRSIWSLIAISFISIIITIVFCAIPPRHL